MRFLMLTPSLPYPPHQGGAIRNYGLLRGLFANGHSLSLLSFHDGSLDPNTTPLAELCIRIETVEPPVRSPRRRLLDLFTQRAPDLARRLYSPAFAAKLVDMLKETSFDLIQLEGLEMAAYLPLIRQHQPSARVCYDAHNAEYALQENIYRIDRRTPKRWPAAVYSWLQAGRIARFECEVTRSVDCVIAVSDEDAAALQPFRPQDKIGVVPNGVFTEAYTGDVQHLDLGENVLVFTGKMDYRPNVDAMLWFSEAIFPLIRQGIPDAKLYIVGQKPHRSLEALRELPGIEITGWVADVQPFLQAADVYIAPLRMGSGTRLKLLEAMATGCAVVATTAAASGLAPQVLNSLTLADDAASFAQQVISLLHNPERRAILGGAAQTDVRRVYDWSALIPTLLSTYEEHGIG